NDVNTLYLAKQKQITIHEKKSSIRSNQLEELSVTVTTNADEHFHVSGSVIPFVGSRITQIQDYTVNLVPKGHLIFIQHEDKPGAIRDVVKILGSHHVNIATMQVDRKEVGFEAMMLLTIDKEPNDEALEQLRQLPFTEKVEHIEMNSNKSSN